jgi:hypothetical protein
MKKSVNWVTLLLHPAQNTLGKPIKLLLYNVTAEFAQLSPIGILARRVPQS